MNNLSQNNIFITSLKQLKSNELIEKYQINLVVVQNWKVEEREMHNIIKSLYSKNKDIMILFNESSNGSNWKQFSKILSNKVIDTNNIVKY